MKTRILLTPLLGLSILAGCKEDEQPTWEESVKESFNYNVTISILELHNVCHFHNAIVGIAQFVDCNCVCLFVRSFDPEYAHRLNKFVIGIQILN